MSPRTQKSIPNTQEALAIRLLEHATGVEPCSDTDLAHAIRTCGMSDLLHNIELPLLPLLSQIEQVGLRVDLARIKQITEAHGRLASLGKRLRAAVDKTTGRVHTHFNSLGTKTVQITTRQFSFGGFSRAMKGAIVADAGRTLILVRYTENNWRIATWLSGDPFLMNAFTNPRVDVFADAARLRLGNQTAKISDSLRGETKAEMYRYLVNHAELRNYGGWGQLWEHLDATANGLRRWRYGLERRTYQAEYVQSPFGRIVAVRKQEMNSYLALLLSVQNIISATSADIFKCAILRIGQLLHHEARLLLIDRESVVLDVPDRLTDEVCDQLLDLMERPFPTAPFSFPVGIHCGDSWIDCLDSETTEKDGESSSVGELAAETG